MQLPADLGALHFIGIGGSGMSGIARLFLDAGYRGHAVPTCATRMPCASSARPGATVAIGHDAANVGDADTLVVTGALWQDNPEYQLRAGPRHPGAAPLAGARLADQQAAPRRRRRRARQDHLDRHDRHRPARARRGPELRQRRRHRRRSAAARRPAPASCSSSRPTSPTARSCSTTPRSRSSRTSTPTTSTTTASQEASRTPS